MSDSSSDQAPKRIEQIGLAAQNAEPANTQPLNDFIARVLQQQGLPPQKINFAVQQVTTEIARSHSGPLPAVEDFAGYNEVCPGSAKEILDMAVRQQQHRHKMDRYVAGCEFWLPVLGIGAAVSVIGGMIAAAVYLALHNYEGLAMLLFTGTGVTTIAGAFLQSRKVDDAETEVRTQKKTKKRYLVGRP